jgi:hypothetical protein
MKPFYDQPDHRFLSEDEEDVRELLELKCAQVRLRRKRAFVKQTEPENLEKIKALSTRLQIVSDCINQLEGLLDD